jgi:AcrR family transcriptional regulator
MPAAATKLRVRQRQERVELVVAEAERLIGEAGYANLVMDRLADRVGVAKATLYLYFPTKEDLLAVVISRDLARFNEQVLALCHRSDVSPRERLILVCHAITERRSALARITHGSETPEIKQVVARHPEYGESWEHIARAVADLIAEGQRSGDFGVDVVPLVAAIAVIELMLAHERVSAMVPSTLRPNLVELLEELFTGLQPRGTPC